jgi:hypothetical protein
MNQSGARLVYNNAVKTFNAAGVSTAKAVLSQSYLRFEIALSTTQTQYTFDTLVNENTNTNYVTQNKLNLQDSFLISRIGFFIAIAASSSVAETVVPLYTYPDAAKFSTANAATSLETVYNGTMTYTVNQRQIVTGWDLYKHKVTPITQTGYTPTGTAATGIANSTDFANHGYYPVEPNLILIGSKKNTITVTLDGTLAAIQANSRLVMVCQGILGQNCTSVR